MLRSRANEIPDLIRRLSLRSSAGVDAARARLAIIGSRAIDGLIVALDGDDDRARARVMPLLALIQDPRGREPLVAMLRDRNVRLREIAARCLGRFPGADSGHALCRAIARDPSIRVKTAAVQALLEHYSAGREESMAPLFSLLTDVEGSPALKLAAMPLLFHLRSEDRSGLLKRLCQDAHEAVRAAAERIDESRTTTERNQPARILAWIDMLGSNDYAIWLRAVQELSACGRPAVERLLDEMRRRSHDPEFCIRAGMALKGMGPRRCVALVEALPHFDEPFPLQVLVEVIGAIGEKSAIYSLKDMIERIAARPDHPTEVGGLDPMQRVRAKAHLELARIGSRVAVEDLRRALIDPDRRVEVELLSALELIGKREELGGLLRAHAREDPYVREQISEVVRAVMKRERIRRNDPVFRKLQPAQRKALQSILPPRSATSRAAQRRGEGAS